MENQNLKFDFVFLGQSILKYQVPLDIFSTINQIYEQNFHNLAPANGQLVGKIEKEEDEYKATKYKIDLDEAIFGKASMEKVAKHRMREIKMWSGLKKEFNDGSFNDKDVNQHQLESYGLQYHEKAKTLNGNSSEAEIFNVMGQLQSLQRIKKSGELENSYKEQEKLEQHGKPKS